MAVTKRSDVDSVAARRIWDDYQRKHDVSDRIGETVGIDAAGGRLWFGKSIEQVVSRRDADACDAPLYFVRVGSPTYYRKGGRK